MLADLSLPEGHLGWSMVALASELWRDQVEAIPYPRRLLLLPHCLRDSAACRAEYDQRGLLCRDCGACRLSEFRALARQKGYQVLIAEGSPMVIDLILRGEVDAILGAACLDSLEKMFSKILVAGIPCMAVPLLHNSCRNTATDEDWIREMINTPYRAGTAPVQSYLPLLRLARGMFEPGELRRLLGEPGDGGWADGNGRPAGACHPAAATEAIARDFLTRGGKHLRPFVTLAAFDAVRGGEAAGPEGAVRAARLPDPIRRIALAIEVFHKASLVHDDIEDDDPFRYGQPALHRKHGTPVAINVGDYLIGLGYRLVAGQRQWLSTEAVADILSRLAEAHTRLCQGQGAELAWRDGARGPLSPLEVLTIYALKTAPAFEAALYAGLRLAGPAAAQREAVARFARHLGVGFQVLNDLDDWETEQPNKRTMGGDVLGRRPTVLWALALENLDPQGRRELQTLGAAPPPEPERLVDRVRGLYGRAGVYELARTLVAKHGQRARQIAAAVQPPPLRHLLDYLADTVLEG
jgi:geranylgeranyl pyrophosphate synthase